ncbi:MAG: hypothetical protein BGO01_11190 [Armatimonadetes bacterium 55-13]|nr:WD40 repeat domain-containing protein [Armatimonadota bacterium]OJU63183.1 MAG: hypothetical protein BGO01_11190 [Armatimonadetes bacterium 55-13]
MTSLLFAALVFQGSTAVSGHTREVACVATSPKAALAASGSADLTVRLWDLDSKKLLVSLEGHGGEVGAVAFSPDGKLLASGERYNKVKIWDVAARKELQTYTDIEAPVQSIVFSTDGKRVIAACKDNAVRIWTVGASAGAKKLALKYMANAVTVTPDGKSIISGDDGGHIIFWDATTLKQTRGLAHGSAVRTLAISGDGKLLASGAWGTLKVWDAATGSEKASAKCEANSVCFAPDGTKVYAGTQDNLVVCFNTSDLSQAWKQESHDRPVTGVAITADGKTLVSGSMDKTLRLWPLK